MFLHFLVCFLTLLPDIMFITMTLFTYYCEHSKLKAFYFKKKKKKKKKNKKEKCSKKVTQQIK